MNQVGERGFLRVKQWFVRHAVHDYPFQSFLHHLILSDRRDGGEVTKSDQRPVPVTVGLHDQIALSTQDVVEHIRTIGETLTDELRGDVMELNSNISVLPAYL